MESKSLQMRGRSENEREVYRSKFSMKKFHDEFVIDFNDRNFIVMLNKGSELPKGFQERLQNHIFELLTGKRTALWDDQAVFGENVNPSREERSAVKSLFNTDDKE